MENKKNNKKGEPLSKGADEMILGALVLVPLPGYSRYLICPKCGSQVFSISNYCSFCGTPLRPQLLLKICPRCKNKIPASVRFCPECGQKQ